MDLFEPQGALQLYVESLQPSGFGNLALRFEQTKARLAEEGLFDAARKRPLPARPRTIAVVTSPTGAVWRDVCNVLARRWPSDAGAPRGVQGAGRGRTREHRRGAPPAGALDGRGARGRGAPTSARRHDPRPWWRVAGGPLVVQRRAGRAGDRRAPGPRRLRRGARGGRDAGGLRRRRPRAHALRRGGARGAGPGRGGRHRRDDRAGGVRRRPRGGWQPARRDTDAERRALDRLEPRAQLASLRERAGLLLDRAARAMGDRLAEDGRRLEMLRARGPRVVEARLAAASGGLASSGASLAALGPQATLAPGLRDREGGPGRCHPSGSCVCSLGHRPRHRARGRLPRGHERGPGAPDRGRPA